MKRRIMPALLLSLSMITGTVSGAFGVMPVYGAERDGAPGNTGTVSVTEGFQAPAPGMSKKAMDIYRSTGEIDILGTGKGSKSDVINESETVYYIDDIALDTEKTISLVSYNGWSEDENDDGYRYFKFTPTESDSYKIQIKRGIDSYISHSLRYKYSYYEDGSGYLDSVGYSRSSSYQEEAETVDVFRYDKLEAGTSYYVGLYYSGYEDTGASVKITKDTDMSYLIKTAENYDVSTKTSLSGNISNTKKDYYDKAFKITNPGSHSGKFIIRNIGDYFGDYNVIDKDGNNLYSSGYNDADDLYWYSYTIPAGGIIYLVLDCRENDDKTYNFATGFVTLETTYGDCDELKPDEGIKVSYKGKTTDVKNKAFRFTPAADGDWYFYSEGDPDTIALLYDGDGNFVAKEESYFDGEEDYRKKYDDCYDGHNFLIDATLKAGETYYLVTDVFNPSDYDDENTCEYTVFVSAEKKSSGYELINNYDLKNKMIDMSFVVDTTGSMGEEIDGVRKNLKEFSEQLGNAGARLRISVIDFGDITNDEPTIVHESPMGSVWFQNADMEDLKAEIDKLKAGDGGDEPESDVDGLGNLIDENEFNFQKSAAKFAFLLTDATYKEQNNHGLGDPDNNCTGAMDELIAKLKEMGIATSVITGKELYYLYRPLADETGGTLININSDFASIMSLFAAQIAKDAAEFVPDPSVIPVAGVKFASTSGTVETIDSEGKLHIPVGRKRNFKVIITPDDATDKNIKWIVGDEEVAEVDEENTTDEVLVIKGKTAGSTTIKARSLDGGYASRFDLIVEDKVTLDKRLESTSLSDIIDSLDNDSDEFQYYFYFNDADETGSVDAESQKKIYKKIKGLEKALSFVFSDRIGSMLYRWRFKGKDIVDDSIAVDMEIDVNKSDSKTAAHAKDKFKSFVTADFKHSGKLPGKATIGIPVNGRLDKGKYKFYHFNESKGILEEEGTATVSDDVAEFDITHCSSYVISDEIVESKDDNGGEGGNGTEEETENKEAEAPKPAVDTSPRASIVMIGSDVVSYNGARYYMSKNKVKYTDLFASATKVTAGDKKIAKTNDKKGFVQFKKDGETVLTSDSGETLKVIVFGQKCKTEKIKVGDELALPEEVLIETNYNPVVNKADKASYSSETGKLKALKKGTVKLGYTQNGKKRTVLKVKISK